MTMFPFYMFVDVGSVEVQAGVQAGKQMENVSVNHTDDSETGDSGKIGDNVEEVAGDTMGVEGDAVKVAQDGLEVTTGSSGEAAIIKTYGGEKIDDFINRAAQGDLPDETEDLVVEESCVLTEDMLVGNLTVENGCLDLNGFDLYVCGDVLHTGGVVVLNGGKLAVFFACYRY